VNKGWKHELRSPLGQVRLLGVTLLGAAIFAGFLGTQTAWFETFVREKPPEVSAATQRLANEIDEGERVPIDRADLEHLYGMWLVADELPSSNIASILTDTDLDWFRDRVERTLVAGTPSQRIRSLALIRTTHDAILVPVLQRALSRYEAIGPDEAIEPCRKTLRVISGGAGH
jgi:hypothetical protein